MLYTSVPDIQRHSQLGKFHLYDSICQGQDNAHTYFDNQHHMILSHNLLKMF